MKRLFSLILGLIGAMLCSADDIVYCTFVGDAMSHTPQINCAYSSKSKTYCYEPCFRYLRPYLAKRHLCIVNLEAPLAGSPYQGYPTFSAPDELVYDMEEAGFNLFAIANNHIADQGQRGITRTIDKMQNRFYTGAYYDDDDRYNNYPLLILVKNIRVAFFNCTYSTNGMPVSSPLCVNLIDTAQILEDLRSIENENIDLRIMMIHWGEEYQLAANSTQRALARFLVRHGFDLIIGSHPHVVQDAEYIVREDGVKVPVFYSLGNFVSNQRWENSNGGIMVQAEISVEKRQVTKVGYVPFYVHKGTIDGNYQYYCIPIVDYLHGTYSFQLSDEDKQAMMRFYELTSERLKNVPILTTPNL